MINAQQVESPHQVVQHTNIKPKAYKSHNILISRFRTALSSKFQWWSLTPVRQFDSIFCTVLSLVSLLVVMTKLCLSCRMLQSFLIQWPESGCWEWGSIFIEIFLVGFQRRMTCAMESIMAVQGHRRSLCLKVLYCHVSEILHVFSCVQSADFCISQNLSMFPTLLLLY